MIRVLLAVVLAAALVGYALPAVEQARASRADTLARDELTDFRATAVQFAATNDPVPAGTAGATLLVTVRVPRDTALGIGVGPHDESLAWDRAGRTRVETDIRFDGTLWLRESGRHRLRLSLVERGRDRVVRVRRFKPERATTTARVRTPLERRLPV